MEGQDSVVDCLRGRLLAERLASKIAKEEAEQLGNKLTELENLLEQEAKSRNRAEKKLKSLLKKLESLNISHVSDGSEYSGSVDKSVISSPSSTTTSSGTQEPKQNGKSEQGSKSNLDPNDSQSLLFGVSDDNSSTIEGSSSSAFEAIFSDFKAQECGEMGQNKNLRFSNLSESFEQINIAQNPIVGNFLFSEEGDANSEKSSRLGSDRNYDDSKMDEQSDICYHSFRFPTEDHAQENKEDDQDDTGGVDNSMALVAVDHMPRENQTIDLDSTVRQVLDALKHAKEQLQSSIGRRRTNMIRVG